MFASSCKRGISRACIIRACTDSCSRSRGLSISRVYILRTILSALGTGARDDCLVDNARQPAHVRSAQRVQIKQRRLFAHRRSILQTAKSSQVAGGHSSVIDTHGSISDTEPWRVFKSSMSSLQTTSSEVCHPKWRFRRICEPLRLNSKLITLFSSSFQQLTVKWLRFYWHFLLYCIH